MKNNKILSVGGDGRSKDRKKRSTSPTLSVVFPREMLDRIEEQAWKARISKGEFVRRLVEKGLK